MLTSGKSFAESDDVLAKRKPKTITPWTEAWGTMPEASSSVFHGEIEKQTINLQWKRRMATMTHNTIYFARPDKPFVVDKIALKDIEKVEEAAVGNHGAVDSDENIEAMAVWNSQTNLGNLGNLNKSLGGLLCLGHDPTFTHAGR